VALATSQGTSVSKGAGVLRPNVAPPSVELDLDNHQRKSNPTLRINVLELAVRHARARRVRAPNRGHRPRLTTAHHGSPRTLPHRPFFASLILRRRFGSAAIGGPAPRVEDHRHTRSASRSRRA